MRKKGENLQAVKQHIKNLTGKLVNMKVCRGRKQIKKYSGLITNVFSNVFVVELSTEKHTRPFVSYSYNDVLCGDVKISENPTPAIDNNP
ncbi:MAG: hypothetical protein LBH47_01290 [Christensenellaceae bacterium]|jgi:uncharacterized protein Veg|nr:hypothetical protein [Christensenellaceae bacterium]